MSYSSPVCKSSPPIRKRGVDSTDRRVHLLAPQTSSMNRGASDAPDRLYAARKSCELELRAICLDP